ncbi:MAG: hypothetical protein ABL308_12705 [Oceanicaulis sp.]
MTEIRTRIEGARELDRTLRRLPAFMRKTELEGAIMTGSNGLRKALRDAAASRPRDQVSGVLERNVSRVRVRKTQFSAQVLVGWFRRGFFAVFEEERAPFARPVWEAEKMRVLDAIGKALGDRLERAAKKVAGNYSKSGLGARRGRRR